MGDHSTDTEEEETAGERVQESVLLIRGNKDPFSTSIAAKISQSIEQPTMLKSSLQPP